MYASVNGATIPATRDMPFSDAITRNPASPICWSQTINVASPTDTVQIFLDNLSNPSAVTVNTLNINIFKIGPNFITNVDQFLGEQHAVAQYIDSSYQVGLMNLVKKSYDVPFSIIGVGNTLPGMTVKEFTDPRFFNSTYYAVQLIGSSPPSANPNYTLQFSGNFGIICDRDEMKTFSALYQISPNGINWTDLDTPQLVYENDFKTDIVRANFYNIQVSLIKYNFIPPDNYENTFIRVVIRMDPNNTVGRFGDNTNMSFNTIPGSGQPNSYFSIYPTQTYPAGVARSNLTMRGNGWTEGGIGGANGTGYYTAQRPLTGTKPLPTINGVEILPTIMGNQFYVVPFIINNSAPDFLGYMTNFKFVHRRNNFRHYYGPSLLELQNLVPLTNFLITHRFYARITNTVADTLTFRIYINGIGHPQVNTVVCPTPDYLIAGPNFNWNIPSIAVNSYMFMIVSWTNPANDGMVFRYIDGNLFYFGY
jgi:hypothetical protein